LISSKLGNLCIKIYYACIIVGRVLLLPQIRNGKCFLKRFPFLKVKTTYISAITAVGHCYLLLDEEPCDLEDLLVDFFSSFIIFFEPELSLLWLVFLVFAMTSKYLCLTISYLIVL